MRARVTLRRATAAAAVAIVWSIGLAASSGVPLIEAVRAGDLATVRTLIAQKADVDQAQPDGATALSWAVYRDDAPAAEALIGAGANVNTANDYGVTPLWLACTNRNGSLVSRLVKAGANVNAALWSGETMLMACSRAGSVDGVQALLEGGATVDAKNPQRGQTALMWAVAARHPEVAALLVKRGADVNARSVGYKGEAPMVFASWGRDVPVPSGGFTPLLFAAQQGDLESIRLLVAAGADVNHVGPEGLTPLLMAALRGHQAAALLLLDKGGDPKAADDNRTTALHYALRDGLKTIHGLTEKEDVQEIHSNDPEVLARLSKTVLVSSTRKPPSPILPGGNMHQLAKALLARGADANAAIGEMPTMLRLQRRPMISLLGATPFLLASITSDRIALDLLLQHGANPLVASRIDERQMAEGGYSDDAQVQANVTPLMVAAGLGREDALTDEEEKAAIETAKLLVARGANVNEASATGWTALHAAAYMGADDLVRYLVSQGAAVDVANGCGQTPLSLAQGDDAKGLLKRTKTRASTVAALRELGAGRNTPKGQGRCVLGRWGI